MENNFLQVMDYLHNLEQRVIQLENNQYLLSLDHKIINFINSTEQTLQYQNQQFNNLNKQVEIQQECLSNFIIQMEIFKYYLTSNIPLNLEQMFNDFVILQQVKNQEQLTTKQLITLLHQKLKGLPINNYFNINTDKVTTNITTQADSDSLPNENITINTIDSTENHKTTRKKFIKKDKQTRKIKVNNEQESINSNKEEEAINTDKVAVPVSEVESNQAISNDNENIVIIDDTNKTINTNFSEISENNINLTTNISQNNETNQNTINNDGDNNSNSYIKEKDNNNNNDDYPEIIDISQRSNEELEKIIRADKLAKKQKLTKTNNSQESNIQTSVNNGSDNNSANKNNNSSLSQDDKLSALKAKRAKLIQHIEHIQKGTDTADNTELTNIESISSCNFNDSNQTNSNSQFNEQSSISVNDSFVIEINHNNLEKMNSIAESTNITTNKENSQVNINSSEKIESSREVGTKTANTEIESTSKQKVIKPKHTRTIVKDDDGSEWVSLN